MRAFAWAGLVAAWLGACGLNPRPEDPGLSERKGIDDSNGHGGPDAGSADPAGPPLIGAGGSGDGLGQGGSVVGPPGGGGAFSGSGGSATGGTQGEAPDGGIPVVDVPRDGGAVGGDAAPLTDGAALED